MLVRIQGNKVNLKPENSLGVGGEAEVFLWDKYAVKIYHKPDPLWDRDKLKEWKFHHDIVLQKLQHFPKTLPKEVVAPVDLVYDHRRNVLGYMMPFVDGGVDIIRLTQKKYRTTHNLELPFVTKVFTNLNRVTQKIHQSSVIVGDYNSLNILFKDHDIFFIDAESMQFSKYPCVVATETYLDPRFYGKDLTSNAWFDKEADWYSYMVMLFQSLLYVHPYGGIHKDYKSMLRRAEAAISVFNSDVRYPKKALPYSILPDSLLHLFSNIFDKKKRYGVIKEEQLTNLKFVQCKICGVYHARNMCPVCKAQVPTKREADKVQGNCRCSTIFEAPKNIFYADFQNGKLKYLYHDKENNVRRETADKVFTGTVTPDMHFEICNNKTVIGKKQTVAAIQDETIVDKYKTGILKNKSMFRCNKDHVFTMSANKIVMDNSVVIGSALENQTWFKVGKTFGYGFYRVGKMLVHFVFGFKKLGLFDGVKINHVGKIIDVDCVFNDTHALVTFRESVGGKTFLSMSLINSSGNVQAFLQEEEHNSIVIKGVRGKTLGGTNAIVPTDDGLMLVRALNGSFYADKIFSYTEPFVTQDTELYSCPEGIYTVLDNKIKLLQIIR